MKKVKSYKPSKFKGKKFEGNKRDQSNSLYDKDWSVHRFRFLHHNPKCYVCNQPSKILDHILAHKGDVNLFWRVDNYMPLCKRCHDTITGLFDRHATPRVEEKAKWIAEQRSRNGNTTRIKIIDIKKKKKKK